MIIVLVLLLFVGVIGGMGFMVYKKMQETSLEGMDTSAGDNITTAQEFLPFEDIQDGMVLLGGHRYRLYIEVSSINYQLRTNGEKEMIDLSYQSFLNSLSSPVAMYLQTRKIDMTRMMEGLRSDIQGAVKEFPKLEAYGDAYYESMMGLTDRIGNNKQKKKYLIISFDEVNALHNLSEKEKYEYAAKEIYNQASLIVDSLTPIGLQSRILDTKAVAELIYSSYHKDNHGHVENIVNGEFMTLIVESEKNPLAAVSDEGKLDWILYEAQSRIHEGLSKESLDAYTRTQMEESLSMLHYIREKHAGHFSNKDEANYALVESDRTNLTKSSFEI